MYIYFFSFVLVQVPFYWCIVLIVKGMQRPTQSEAIKVTASPISETNMYIIACSITVQ
jgi:hypothetical protein